MPLPPTAEFLRLLGVPDHWPAPIIADLARLFPGDPLGFFEAVNRIKKNALP